MDQDKHRHQDREFNPNPSNKIKHTPSGLGEPRAPGEGADLSSITMPDEPLADKPKEIRALGMKVRRHEDNWTRTPNTPGTGAIHVRSFHSKVTEDGMIYMDQMINEWLDQHPQYEVKFVQTSIGTFTGKIKEPHIFCQVWV